MARQYKFLLFILFGALPFGVSAQAKHVILEGFVIGPHWDGAAWDTIHTGGVPCPADSMSFPKTKRWYYNELAGEANSIASAGFTAVWLPSVAKGSAGYYGGGKKNKRRAGGIYDVGYGIFDDYDLGDKLQQGTIPTRYGTRGQLTNCVAVMRANGLDVYHDFVLNQRNGLNMTPVPPAYQVAQYKDAYGNVGGGRFPKYLKDFHRMRGRLEDTTLATDDPHTPASEYPDGTPTGEKEHLWGPDFAHITGQRDINGTKGVWCATQLEQWGDWLLKATGMQGYRLDDVSGISWDFVKDFVNYGAMKGKFSISENVGTRNNVHDLMLWMQNCVGEKGSNFTIFDQVLQPVLLKMCKTSQFNMGVLQSRYLSYNSKKPELSINAINPSAGSADPGKQIWYRSIMASDPEQAVTVLNEVDMESTLGDVPRAALPKECLLGYAYLLAIGYGTPCISIKDWGTAPYCYGSTMIDGNSLNYHINNLIWCHNFVISGGLSNEQAVADGNVYAFQKTGGRQAMVFLNSDQTNSHLVTVSTSIPNGTVLVDYTGHKLKTTVVKGHISLTVPANKNGRGYLIMAPPGITGSLKPTAHSITQEWDASADLSIPPATDKKQLVCRIQVDKNKPVTATLLKYNAEGWAKNSSLELEIDRSSADSTSNIPIATQTYSTIQHQQQIELKGVTRGWYSIWVKGKNLPKGNNWFNLQITYTAPKLTTD